MHCRGQVLALDRLVSSGTLRLVDAPVSALAAEGAIDDAEAAIARSADLGSMLARAMALAADGYAFAESMAARAARQLAATIGYEAGYLLPVLAVLALPGVAATAGIARAYSLAPPEARERVDRTVAKMLWESRASLSDPRVVDLVRLSVMSADDFGGGLLRVPSALESLLGDEGLGVLGLDTSAAAVVGVASPFGALKETEVAVAGGPTVAGGKAPLRFEDRADRIPTKGSQIRIDRYVRARTPRPVRGLPRRHRGLLRDPG